MQAEQIVRADPRMRRQALLIVATATLVGVAVIGFGLPWLERWVTDAIVAGNAGARRMVCLSGGGLIVGLSLLVAVSGLNMMRIGRRVVRAERFPPPGHRVLRDTRVVDGRAARLLGRVQGVLGLLVLACALALLGLGGYAVVRLWP